jgi:hypothetical protein
MHAMANTITNCSLTTPAHPLSFLKKIDYYNAIIRAGTRPSSYHVPSCKLQRNGCALSPPQHMGVGRGLGRGAPTGAGTLGASPQTVHARSSAHGGWDVGRPPARAP